MAQSPVSALTSDQLVSTFDTVHKPEELNTLFRRYGDQGLSFFLILKSMGFTMPAAQTIYGWSEEDWIHDNFHVRNNVGDPGAGNSVQITLEAQDLDSSNNFYPRLKDMILFPNDVIGVVTDVDTSSPAAPVLTIDPHDNSENIGALSAGDEIVVASGLSSEGAGQPEAVISRTLHEENEHQIIKDTMSVTGSEMTNQIWFSKDSDGRKIPAYYIKGQMDLDYRMQLRMDGALLVGKRITGHTINDPDTGRPLRGTDGIIPKTRANGINISNTPGNFTVAKFDQMNNQLDREFASNNYIGLLGYQHYQDVNNTLIDYFKDTDAEYVRREAASDLMGGDDGLMGSIDFNYLKKGGRTFMFKKAGVFNHPKYLGSTGYDYPNTALYLPLSQKRDKTSNKSMPQIGCRYKEMNGYSRMMETWITGGAGTNAKTDDLDKMNVYSRSEIGAHHMGANQFAIVEP